MLDHDAAEWPAGGRTWEMRGRRRKKPARGKAAARKFVLGAAVSVIDCVERLGAMGCTVYELAGFFNVSQVTASKRLKDCKALRRAWDAGRAVSQISVMHLLHQKAQRPTSDGTRAALFLARQLIWPQDGDDGVIEPAEAEAPGGRAAQSAEAQFARLTAEEKATLNKLMEKLRGGNGSV